MQDLADSARQQLGWYMRDCALSPAASRLEFVLLERLNVLKGASDDDESTLDLTKAKKRRVLMHELR